MENQIFFKRFAYAKHTDGRKRWPPEPAGPAHLRLAGEEGEGIAGVFEKMERDIKTGSLGESV